MTGHLGISLIYRMYDYILFKKKQSIFRKIIKNFENYNNVLYNALQIFENEDFYCDGELTQKQALNAYKSFYKFCK